MASFYIIATLFNVWLNRGSWIDIFVPTVSLPQYTVLFDVSEEKLPHTALCLERRTSQTPPSLKGKSLYATYKTCMLGDLLPRGTLKTDLSSKVSFED